jgi:D-sedoheptulose 7-phosphate isomerase
VASLVVGSGREADRSGVRQAIALDAFVARRVEAGGRFFETEATRIAVLCRDLAERFVRGGRLLAVGESPQTWSDAHHVAVEFVHPVIVGKRALPALAVEAHELEGTLESDDAVVSFEPLRFRLGSAEWRFDPASDDPFVRQELCETLYHVVWELVHVFFEHLGGSTAGAGDANFLYPFLAERSSSLDHVVDDVRQSVLMKSEEISRLREQTLGESGTEIGAAAADVRRALERGGALLALGNGGSATDAADVVADFRAAPQGWPHRRALDLAADSAILTALANDIGPDVLFQRQVIAYGRPGDVVLALSTSGSSANVVAALEEARRRGLGTIAMVGYDGGRVASEGLADHVVVSRSEHIPRIQEAQATAYHVLRELVESPA